VIDVFAVPKLDDLADAHKELFRNELAAVLIHHGRTSRHRKRLAVRWMQRQNCTASSEAGHNSTVIRSRWRRGRWRVLAR
jgi:hypothetical protein